MGTTIQAHHVTGKTLYFQVRDFSGQVFSTVSSLFEAYSTANRANYDVAMTEEGTASGHYVGTFPAAIAVGDYAVEVFDQVGGAPAEGDTLVAVGSPIPWDGSALIETAILNGQVVLRSGTAQAGTLFSITLDAGASATNDLYVGSLVSATNGTGAEQVRLIVFYDGTTKIATVVPPWEVAPDATTGFAILPAGLADIVAIQANDTAANNLSAFYSGVATFGLVSDASPAAGSFNTNLTAIDNFHDGAYLVFISGALIGQPRKITTYLNAGGNVVFTGTVGRADQPFSVAPANSDPFIILGRAGF